MRRTGSTAGDLVYVIGEMGLFWSAVLAQERAPELLLGWAEQAAAREALTRPVARVEEAGVIAASGLATACMDASDGVLGALQEIGRVNRLDVRLADPVPEPAALVRTVADHLGLPLLKLLLAWGDWQLVTTVRPGSRDAFEKLAQSLKTRVTMIGQMTPGNGRVLADDGGQPRVLANLASERFSERSYFGPGIKAYLNWFVDAPIWADQS
jgi:thiamine-monophosphate kinase